MPHICDIATPKDGWQIRDNIEKSFGHMTKRFLKKILKSKDNSREIYVIKIIGTKI